MEGGCDGDFPSQRARQALVDPKKTGKDSRWTLERSASGLQPLARALKDGVLVQHDGVEALIAP